MWLRIVPIIVIIEEKNWMNWFLPFMPNLRIRYSRAPIKR